MPSCGEGRPPLALPSGRAPLSKTDGLNSSGASSRRCQGRGVVQRRHGWYLKTHCFWRLCTAPAEVAGCSPRPVSPVGIQRSKIRHPAPFQAQQPAPGGGAEPRTAGLGAALLRFAAGAVRSVPVRAPVRHRLRARDGVSSAGRLSRPGRLSQACVFGRTILPARRRSALHFRPPGLRARSGAGSPGSLREHEVLLTDLLPQEPWRFGFPHGDTQYSPFPPGRGRCALLPPPSQSSPPLSPRQRILSRLPLRLPLLGCGGSVARQAKGKVNVAV